MGIGLASSGARLGAAVLAGWATFLKAHWDVLAAIDFTTIGTSATRERALGAGFEKSQDFLHGATPVNFSNRIDPSA